MNPKAQACACLLVFLSSLLPSRASQSWHIHEWGTFTSLQDEAGEAIGGINTDDEPVPPFVHQLSNFILLRPTETPNNFFQGAPSCHPDVTMRMETPVIYFHPPNDLHGIRTADVNVAFHGGWLTEFYPEAQPKVATLTSNPFRSGPARLFQFGPLRSNTVSTLTWSNLKIGGDWPLTNATQHVWTSPRAVTSAKVQTTNFESEQFLFYRGVAHIDAPLRVSREDNQLVFRSQWKLPTTPPPAIGSLWLVDIRPDGTIAYRPLPSLQLDSDSTKILTKTSAQFKTSDYTAANLEKLKAALQAALIGEGLFIDEARALINTWELSYFKSAGLRVFFIVPRAWTDFYLPLNVSVLAEINRVMVGRIELVTPEQREQLKEIAELPRAQMEQELGQMFTNFYGKLTFNVALGFTNPPTRQEIEQFNQTAAQVNAGLKPLASFIPVPKGYQTYLDLGRFRNALILEESRRHPALTNFISLYRLEAYQPTSTLPKLLN